VTEPGFMDMTSKQKDGPYSGYSNIPRYPKKHNQFAQTLRHCWSISLVMGVQCIMNLFLNVRQLMWSFIWKSLTLCNHVTCKGVIVIPCIVDASCISTFLYLMPARAFVSCSGSPFTSKLLTAWASNYKHIPLLSLKLQTHTAPGPQITNTYRSWPHILTIIILQQSDIWMKYPLYFLLYLPSVGNIALSRNVLKKDDILWVICRYMFWYLWWFCTQNYGSDNYIPTTSSRKQLWPSAVLFPSDSETSTCVMDNWWFNM
jgi:hypothetical protein